MKKTLEYHGIIYKATNIVNSKVYIGQTTHTLEHRKKNHIALMNCQIRNNKKILYFYKAIEKHGIDSFIWEIIDTAFSKDELNKKEIYWIEYYKSLENDKGYNIAKGGHYPGSLLLGMTDEEKSKIYEKISVSNTGKKRSEKVKQEMSIRRTGSGNSMFGKTGSKSPHFGKTRSEDIRLKISLSNMGKTISQEQRDKISKTSKERGSHKGENNSKFGRGGEIVGENNPMFGKHHTGESKKLISHILKEKYKNGTNKPGHCRKVICLETQEVFESLMQAAEIKYSDKKYHKRIVRSIKKNKIQFGFTWKYYTEELNEAK